MAIKKSNRALALDAAAILMLGGVAWICARSWMSAQAWPRLKTLDSSLAVLDDPPRLLKLVAHYKGPRGGPSEYWSAPTNETRLEALRALLALQERRFHLPLLPQHDGCAVGAPGVVLRPARTPGVTRIEGTPSLDPNSYDPDQPRTREHGYWYWEEMTFNAQGRLLSRAATRCG